MRANLVVVGLAGLLACGPAGAGEEAEPIDVAWPVASFDVPVADEATVAVTLVRRETTTTFPAEPGTTVAFLPARRPTGSGAAEALARRIPPPLRAGLRMVQAPSGVVLARPAPEARSAFRGGLARLEAGTRVELRVVVRPENRPPARSTWPGSVAEFERFLAEESARWGEARLARRPYEASRAGFLVAPHLLVPDLPRGPSVPALWEVLEEPAAEDDFGGGDLEAVSASPDARGGVVLRIALREERRGALQRWGARAVGHPLALVVDGRVAATWVPSEPLRDALEIPLGAGVDAATQGRELVAQVEDAMLGPAPLLALVEPGPPGRRRLWIPVREGEGVTLRLEAPGAPVWRGAARHRALDAVAPQAAVEALLAAQAVGRLAAPWTEPFALQLTPDVQASVLLDRAQAPESGRGVRADALELMARLAADDVRVVRALAAALTDPSPEVRAALAWLKARPRFDDPAWQR